MAIVVGALAALAVLALVAVLALSAHPTLPERAAGPLAFDEATVRRGAALAAVGNCASCHTASSGAPYAGGVALATPFGTVHGTNITPDPDTGVGRWSEAAFVRAMREGVDRDGGQLYPAFPYDHFTRLHDDDLHALYAFVMTRDPVHAPNPANALRFPFGFRPLVAGWNLLFLERGPAPAEGTQDPQAARGEYLVRSLAHCGACHTPRNAFGAEERAREFAGGEAEGWYAPALDAHSPSPLPWSVDELTAYLRTGIAGEHAIAGGPMQEVVASLARAPLDDVRAIATAMAARLAAAAPAQQARAAAAHARIARAPLAATSVAAPMASPDSASIASATMHDSGATATTLASTASSPGASTATTPASAASSAGPTATLTTAAATDTAAGDQATLRLGGAVYAQACAGCHDRGRDVSSNGALQLPLAIAVYDPDPRSLLRIVRQGIAPPPGEPGRFMPAFGTSLSDEQLVGLLVYLRATAAEAPPWPDAAAQVRASKAPS